MVDLAVLLCFPCSFETVIGYSLSKLGNLANKASSLSLRAFSWIDLISVWSDIFFLNEFFLLGIEDVFEDGFVEELFGEMKLIGGAYE